MTTGSDSDRLGGFIVIHRRIESWPLWRLWNGTQRGIWISMLLEANWKPTEIIVKEGRVVVHRGEYVTSQVALARKFKVSRKEIRTVYAHLEAEGAITTRRLGTPLVGRGGGHQVVAVTIVNYSKYQDVPDRKGHQRDTKGPHQNQLNQGTKKLSRQNAKPQHPSPSDTGGDEPIFNMDEWRRRRDERLSATHGHHGG